MKNKSQLQREIREAKRKLDNATHGTPEREALFKAFWELQGELGKLELAELGIEARK